MPWILVFRFVKINLRNANYARATCIETCVYEKRHFHYAVALYAIRRTRYIIFHWYNVEWAFTITHEWKIYPEWLHFEGRNTLSFAWKKGCGLQINQTLITSWLPRMADYATHHKIFFMSDIWLFSRLKQPSERSPAQKNCRLTAEASIKIDITWQGSIQRGITFGSWTCALYCWPQLASECYMYHEFWNRLLTAVFGDEFSSHKMIKLLN